MPIRAQDRWFYPIDWPQLSIVIRFKRAGGRCEQCGRPHGRLVWCLDDGRWWDAESTLWRDSRGRRLRHLPRSQDIFATIRSTKVVLATAHLDHDPSNNSTGNLKALCQRCHLLYDRREHRRRRWLTLHRRKALGDLFLGPYLTR
ncbi:hypothetical protein [Beijerinckia indica]|uniref:HNH endonuclease n=1 Tax=Beijerinckia indica subsp. indica (strain ATCC 9039 / DSM 1715 / NCIMB 8712) TaxID=395963 RepID=B2ILL7_BEII9|nr:hypothetical protein [Beijerinckia indica]ACB97417.1 conserved hypothetical protein [Beijerinckia indica subsp. indica ATCC 9039]